MDGGSGDHEEVENFIDLLFFGLPKFNKRVDDIRYFFLEYFAVVKNLFQTKKKLTVNLDRTALVIFEFIVERVVNEAKEFYLGTDDLEAVKDEIKKYWHSKVLLKHSDAAQGVAASTIHSIRPRELAQSHLDQIVDAAGYFLFWPPDKQEEFITALNPNRFLNEEKDADKLLKFLRLIEPIDASPEPSVTSSTEIVPHQAGQRDWLKMVMDKIGWENAHPYFIAELWANGTDKVRDLVFSRRKEIKITLKSFKDYYLREHRDLRLFSYALEKLVSQDVIRTEYMWNELFRLSENMNGVRAILKLKSQEVKK